MSARGVRAFVAVFPPPSVAQGIGTALEALRSPGDGIAWVRGANLHYTMRFLGELDPRRLEAARGAVRAAAGGRGVAPFAMRLGGPGAFPGPARPRVLWLGAAEGASPLTLLAGALDDALVRAGFGRAERPFTPHLTTGRVREGGGEAARAAAARFLAAAWPASEGFEVRELQLVASTLAPGGSRYEPLERAVLGSGGGGADAGGTA
jgi:2'-5' RNA ligase